MTEPSPSGRKPPPHVPLWRWILWIFMLAFADFLFYVLLTPLWLGIRAAAWLSDKRSRRRQAGGASPT
ncbi:MAG TPA: hypothetical protein VGH79_08415 [Gaiellaceae bacterium]